MLQQWLACFTPMILSAPAAGPSLNKIQVIRCAFLPSGASFSTVFTGNFLVGVCCKAPHGEAGDGSAAAVGGLPEDLGSSPAPTQQLTRI